jgi:hypothetical protein
MKRITRTNVRYWIKNIIHNSEIIEHSGKSVKDHLIGTFIILDEWNASEKLKIAGAFHNIYDTEKFKMGFFDQSEREYVSKKIGGDAEYIVYLFSKLKWSAFMNFDVDKNSRNYKNYFRDIDEVDIKEFENIVLLFFANLIEQVDVIPNPKKTQFLKLAEKYSSFLGDEKYSHIYSVFKVN